MEKKAFLIGSYDVDEDLEKMLDHLKANTNERSYVKTTLPHGGTRIVYGHNRTIARTATMNIYCKSSLIEYKEDGLTHVRRMEVHDDRTSPICRVLNGTIHRIDRLLSFELPQSHDSHPNCVLPDTMVSVGSRPNFLSGVIPNNNILGGFVSTYKGPIVKLILSDGRRLSVTVNHMLLTPNGFVRAGDLRKGDNVIGRSLTNWKTIDIPNNNNCPTRIQDVVGSLSKSFGCMTHQMKVSAKDFHGDGIFMNGNVDIIRTDSELRSAVQSGISKPISNRDFTFGFNDSSFLLSLSPLEKILFSAGHTLDGSMSRFRELKASFLAKLFHSYGISFGSSSSLDSVFIKNSINSYLRDANGISYLYSRLTGGISTNDISFINGSSMLCDSEFLELAINSCASDTKLIGDLLNGPSCGVEPIDIVDVSRFDYNGHVYDLHTASSLYLSEGIVNSNCRGTFVPFFDAGGYKPMHRDIPTRLNFLKYENAPREFEPWLRGINKHITFNKVIFTNKLQGMAKVEGKCLFINLSEFESDPRDIILEEEAKKVFDAKKFKEIQKMTDAGLIEPEKTHETPLEHFSHLFVAYKLNQLEDPVIFRWFKKNNL
jgi:SPP1 gp7 family putative phage head morphogenesis protein